MVSTYFKHLLYTLLFSLCIAINIVKSDIYSCPRLRKAWHLTTDAEKQLYIKGIHRLNDEGKFKHFGSTHHHIVDSAQAHNTAEFFAWHRYFLWEFENQIRSFGTEYECFSVPYWDITTDAGLFEDSFIFNSGLGGIGDIENDECVDISNTRAWSSQSFPLTHICHENINEADNPSPSDGCCLKRASAKMDVSGISSYTHYILKYNNFGAADGFRQTTFAGYHSEAHSFVGGIWANYTHMISRYSSLDPIFYLLHSWFEYIFVVWKQCWGYNKIDMNDLDAYPAAYFAFPVEDFENGIPSSELDDKLYFIPMTDIDWWSGELYKPTARTTWNEQDWNIQYEKGTFILRSHLSELCENGWDENVLLQNSAETENIISLLAESEMDKYQDVIWNYMKEKKKEMHVYSDVDFVQTWAAKTCNYQRQSVAKSACSIPQEYEKCGDDDYLRRAELSIEELLQKEGVSGNDCLEEVRINIYSWAKAMGMLYQLCIGEFDKYFICETPNVDFLVDLDDEEYYEKLISNKEKMKKEVINDNNNNKELSVIMENVNIRNNYPHFDVMGYIVIAFVIGGCAFIALIGHCKGQCNSKLSNHSKSRFNYGSMVEML